jgi:hypothetical protein
MIKKIFGLFILASLLVPVAAKADTEAWEFTQVTATSSIANYNLGVVFSPTVNITVDELGYYDPSGGLLYSHGVALYNSSGGVVTSANVAAFLGATQTGNFLYTAVTPVTLVAGQTYVLEGNTSGHDQDNIAGTDKYGVISAANVVVDGFGTDLPLTIAGDNLVASVGMAYNGTTVGTHNDYFGADFGGYTVTPEPSTLLLLGSGLAGLAGLIKRKLMA